jgi:hypothetical protein
MWVSSRQSKTFDNVSSLEIMETELELIGKRRDSPNSGTPRIFYVCALTSSPALMELKIVGSNQNLQFG